MKPTVYYVDPRALQTLSVRLAGDEVPETLQRLDALWKRLVPSHPLDHYFLEQFFRDLYSDIERQAKLIGVFAAIAVCVAGLGLLGLSVFTTQRRTREIGIRKAMGAGTSEIVRLLLWHFTRPVLWANVVAWPAAAYLMHRWLQSFAYHIDLEAWMFVTAGAMAVATALLTVGTHSISVARAKPVAALRYE